MKRLMLIVIVALCAAFAIGRFASPKECPVDMEYLIAIEVEWVGASGHAGEADEMKDGRKCWRVEKFDFHGQVIWPAWRCVVLEGPMLGTIQWEWRNPMRRD